MFCLYGALLNPDVAPAALPEPYRQRPSRAAGSFSDPIVAVSPRLLIRQKQTEGSGADGA